MDREIWEDVAGYEGLYQVSNYGKVKSLSTNKIRKAFLHKGYYYTSLSKNSIVSYLPIHRLVAIAFIPRIYNKPHVNHKDGNKTNNYANNLEWVTHKENMQHARKNNLISKLGISNSVNAMINATKKSVLQIKDGIVIKEFDSISQAKRETKINHICECAEGKRKTTGGFEWKYL